LLCLAVIALAVIGAGCALGFRSLRNAGELRARALGKQILGATDVQGGLIVHVGCGDGTLTSALRASDSFLVHGVDADPSNVVSAREHIRSRGVYGQVSVDRFDGKRLPYVDNLANLVVAEDLGAVPMSEVMRVLCPNGVAYIKNGDEWTKTLKPRPAEIDEWTHYLHDPSNNAVAHDAVVGPPQHLQWVGSPRWARHHDRMASLSAMVSAGGRVFYILDEGSRASIQLPPKWRLIARDAFNGVVLWKRLIDIWHPTLWPLKSGPAQPQRRLVAVGDTVYVTLGLDAPLAALDAATGKTIRTYPDTHATEEVIASEGVLFLLTTESPMLYDDFRPERVRVGQERDRVSRDWPWNGKPRRVMAIEAATGKALWRAEHTVVPLTLAVDLRCVYFHDGERVVCLDRNTGREQWKSEPVERRSVIPASFGPTLVVYDDVVLFAGGNRSMTALSAQTGKTLWSADHSQSGHYSPEDLLVIDGVAWSGATANRQDSGEFVGRDVHTGEIRSRFQPDTDIYFMHQRCYRSKATDRYLLPSRTGIEFIDPKAKHWIPHHWVRGGCIYGIMPCNGLVYTPPHSCACYMEAKLCGLNALAPSSSTREIPDDMSDDTRIERGPAWNSGDTILNSIGAVSRSEEQNAELSIVSPELESEDWPTYRHDATRSGATKTAVPAELKRAWDTGLGGRLTSVVVAEGKLFVASVNAHTVHALDANSGKKLWGFTTGGRVDSPPTIWQGRALFGSADGYIYCLRASDGALIWRFRAAPTDRRLVAFEQLESVWPVPGNVMVLDGSSTDAAQPTVYCVAGRSMFLDGGLRLLRLDPRTGRKLSETVLDEFDPETGKSLQDYVSALNMPVALPDVLSCDGANVYMRSQQFDLEGHRRHIAPTDISPASAVGGMHLFSPTGFLDGSWWHRSYWVYGKGFAEGAGGWPQAGKVVPAGHLLVFDGDSVYGYGRQPEYYKWTTPVRYQLFAMAKNPKVLPRVPRKPGAAQQRRKRARLPRVDLGWRWRHEAPLQVRAIALAGDSLFIAGPPIVIDEEEAFDHPYDPVIKAKLEQQSAALEGHAGGLLMAVSASDGTKLAEYKLDSPPAWDGMAATNGRLYLSTIDGEVLCFAGVSPSP